MIITEIESWITSDITQFDYHILIKIFSYDGKISDSFLNFNQ